MPSGGSADMTSGDFTGEGSATSSRLICMIIVHVLLTCTFYTTLQSTVWPSQSPSSAYT